MVVHANNAATAHAAMVAIERLKAVAAAANGFNAIFVDWSCVSSHCTRIRYHSPKMRQKREKDHNIIDDNGSY